MTRHVFRAGIHFNTPNDSGIGDEFHEGSAIFLLLADRFVENYAANALAETWRGQNQLPPGVPGMLGLGNPQFGKSFVARRITFIHRQQTPVAGDQRARGSNTHVAGIHLVYRAS